MATAQSVVKRALRLLAITQTGEEPSADEAQDALSALNEMLFSWELESIPLEHIEMAWTDTLPFPTNHIRPITYNLALVLADEYGKQPTQMVFDIAQRGYRNLQNFYLDYDDLPVDPAINPYYSPNRYNY